MSEEPALTVTTGTVGDTGDDDISDSDAGDSCCGDSCRGEGDID